MGDRIPKHAGRPAGNLRPIRPRSAQLRSPTERGPGSSAWRSPTPHPVPRCRREFPPPATSHSRAPSDSIHVTYPWPSRSAARRGSPTLFPVPSMTTRLSRRRFLAASAGPPRRPGRDVRARTADKLNLAVIGVADRGGANLDGVAAREHRRPVRRRPAHRLEAREGAVPQGRVLHRLPQDVRQGRQASRRRRRQHAGPLARLPGVHRDEPRQARLLREAAGPLGRRGAADAASSPRRRSSSRRWARRSTPSDNYRRVVEIVQGGRARAGQPRPRLANGSRRSAGRRPARSRRRSSTSTCGSGRRPATFFEADDRTSPRGTAPGRTSTGGTGGSSAAARSPTSAATTWTCRSGRWTSPPRRRVDGDREEDLRRATTPCPT